MRNIRSSPNRFSPLEIVSIAFACNLQKFDNPRGYRNMDWGLMNGSPIQNEMHALERANLWWSIYVQERSLALAASIIGTIPVETCGVGARLFPLFSGVANFGSRPSQLSFPLPRKSSLR